MEKPPVLKLHRLKPPGLKPPGLKPHGLKPHGLKSHGLKSHELKFHGLKPYGLKLHGIKPPVLKPGMRILLYLLSGAAAALSIWQAVFGRIPEFAGYLLYALAFVLLCVGIFYLQRDVRRLGKDVVLPLIERNPLTRRAYRDYEYRTLVTAACGTAINLGFTVYNGIWGILNHSVWFITMAVYYSLLGGMRFFSIQAKRKADMEREREKAFRREIAVMKGDGVVLLLMTTALGSIVFYKITGNMVTPYSAELAIATAAYTFYKLIFAVRNMLKVRGLGSLILTAVRNIAFADALVSLFSLQVLMMVSFSSESSETYEVMMNSITGLMVCATVILMGIWMVRASGDTHQHI